MFIASNYTNGNQRDNSGKCFPLCVASNPFYEHHFKSLF